MKRNVILLLIIIIISLAAVKVQAVDTSYGGNLETYFVQKQDELSSRLELKLKFNLSKSIYSFKLNDSVTITATDMQSSEINNNLNNAYLNIWLTEGMIKAGKQRIARGSAYFFNPGDIINPIKEEAINNDIEGRRSTDIIYGEYYLGMDTIAGGVICNFQPCGPENKKEAAVLARQFNPYFNGKLNMPEGFKEESEYFITYSTFLNKYDLSFMFYKGREDYPVSAVNPVESTVTFNYPEKKTAAVNIAGTLGIIGVWGEAAYTEPDMGSNYLQYIIGADYTFKNGLHILAEYYYDDSFENFIPGQEINTNDFLCLEADYNLTDLIKLTSCCITPLDSNFYFISGEIDYSLAEDVELKAGINKVENEEGSVFAEHSSLFPLREKLYLQLTHYF